MPTTTPYYGGDTVTMNAGVRDLQNFPRGGGQFVQLGSLGATDLSPLLYSGASMLGASLGGGLVGYVASKNRRGAITGAALVAGIAGCSDALALGLQSRTGLAAILGIAGLGALSFAVYRFNHAK